MTSSGAQALHLVGERVGHRLDAAGVGRGELLDEVDDAGQAVDVDRHLRLGDLEAGEVGDALDLGARQAHAGNARSNTEKAAANHTRRLAECPDYG